MQVVITIPVGCFAQTAKGFAVPDPSCGVTIDQAMPVAVNLMPFLHEFEARATPKSGGRWEIKVEAELMDFSPSLDFLTPVLQAARKVQLIVGTSTFTGLMKEVEFEGPLTAGTGSD